MIIIIIIITVSYSSQTHFSLETPKSKKENPAGSSVTSPSLSTFSSRLVLALTADVNHSYVAVPLKAANTSGSAHPVPFLWGCLSLRRVGSDLWTATTDLVLIISSSDSADENS